ncbi:acyl-CoA dehydrogenase family protein [Kushneria indalinina]|uniref:Alkylation response protein AidB-like acyl-CoA dehydrogenase n=1 Tax=Kushneria indalinina DSM 14324 TaxID=1122140 RepID=A0A3D9DVJ4_9GAMM|nr:acyl-CoA dehydrogenase [Kushneria indalinina]REC94782.1 alkylation response protein AidB-like acyl-CoA dehydrogenase [Kushneria indalinina DSM 14324]
MDASPLRRLDDVLTCHDTPAEHISALANPLDRLIALGPLPPPGAGDTLLRWRVLYRVAACDLALIKLYEGHTDALAIMTELGVTFDAPTDARWAMWAAEPPQARVYISDDASTGEADRITLNGTKAWCSGASIVSHALMTVWQDDQQRLAAVALDQPGVNVTDRGWQAVGMQATASVEVDFDNARATLIGPPNAYLNRSGFWQGGAGIAACWLGGAQALARALQAKAATRRDDTLMMAHLGHVDVALHAGLAGLRDAAATIDAAPDQNHQRLALRTRALIEHSVEQIITHCGRALGAGPFCRDRAFAHMMADLPVYLRQSHAERDLEALGQRCADTASGWQP